jgi:hypothetical protein
MLWQQQMDLDARTGKIQPQKARKKTTIRTKLKLSSAILITLFCGCGDRFYVMYPVQVETSEPASLAASSSSASSELNDNDRVIPYLTLTAHGYTENFFKATRDFNHDLQVFKVDAEFTLPSRPEPVSTVIMALDLASDPNTDHASRGREILKSIPVIASSTTAIDLKLSSSAVEKKVADRFLQGVDIIMKTVGPMLSTSLGPEATAAIGAGTDVLKLFKSNKSGTTSDRTLTLNPTNGILRMGSNVILFVPTGDAGPGEQLPDRQAPADPRLNQDQNSKAFLRRLIKIQNTKFALCSTKPHMLCTKDNNIESEYNDFAYLLIEATYSYRITFPSFLWLELTPQTSCPFDKKRVDAYAAALSEQRERLTPSQAGAEDEILATMKNVLDGKEFAEKRDTPALFGLISAEWHRGTPAGRLFTMNHVTGRPYSDIQSDLRECIVASAESVKGGIFREYSGSLAALIESDKATAKPPANDAEAERFRQKYEGLLPVLIAIKNNLKALSIDAPEVAASLSFDITRTDEKIYALVFRKAVGMLFSINPADQAAGKDTIKRLLGTTRCESCKERAQKALVDSGQAPNANERTLITNAATIGTETTVLRGEVRVSEVLKAAAGQRSDPVLKQKADEQLTRIEGLVQESLSIDKDGRSKDNKIKDARKLLDELKQDLRVSQTLLQ